MARSVRLQRSNADTLRSAIGKAVAAQVRIELSLVEGDLSGAIKAALSPVALAQLLDLTVITKDAETYMTTVYAVILNYRRSRRIRKRSYDQLQYVATQDDAGNVFSKSASSTLLMPPTPPPPQPESGLSVGAIAAIVAVSALVVLIVVAVLVHSRRRFGGRTHSSERELHTFNIESSNTPRVHKHVDRVRGVC
jgi:hypothetical protein